MWGLGFREFRGFRGLSEFREFRVDRDQGRAWGSL